MMPVVRLPASLNARSCGYTGATPSPPPTSTTCPTLLDVLRQAQRADEIGEAVAFLVMVAHLERGLAERLDHHGDGALVAVEIGHRQRNALAAFVQAQHDEMAGLRRVRHVGGLHLPQEGRVGERFAADDFVHRNVS